MSEQTVQPAARPLSGRFTVPGDKSISHRAVILGSLAVGETHIHNFLPSETTAATIECLRRLKADILETGPGLLRVHGGGLGSLREPQEILYCRGSGTTMRLLAGLAAGQTFLTVLDGSAALERRPMARIVEPLRAMGATVLARGPSLLPPLAIRGKKPVEGIEYALPVASAQVKSALLIAGLYASGPVTLREPTPSRDHTERMLRAMGAKVESRPDGTVRLFPPACLNAPTGPISIPGDFSSSAFLLAASLLVPGSAARFEGVGLNPGRIGLLQVLEEMGVRIEIEQLRESGGEPVGDLVVHSCAGLRGVHVGGELVPRMIDEFPLFAVIATQADGETRVRDAAELRVKESDRITTLVAELSKMGARIEPTADGFAIEGPTRLSGARVNSHQDHRLAMSLAVAGLLAKGHTIIEGWECVRDSFPGFAEQLARVQP